MKGKLLFIRALFWLGCLFLFFGCCTVEGDNNAEQIQSVLRKKLQRDEPLPPSPAPTVSGGSGIVVTDGLATPSPTQDFNAYCSLSANPNPKVLESRALCGGCNDEAGLCSTVRDIQPFCNYQSKATDQGSAYFGARRVSNFKCATGTFEDPNGNCYSCPRAMGDDGVLYQTIRGATSVLAWNACYYVYSTKIFPFLSTVYASAVDYGKWCTGTPGAWFDLLTGSCWVVSILCFQCRG